MHDQLAPVYHLSVLDHSQVIADQTFELSIFFSLASLGDALYRTAVATAVLYNLRKATERITEHSAS